MLSKYYSIFLIIFCLNSFGYYNTALEIKREDAGSFEGFLFEYSYNPFNKHSWGPVVLKSNDPYESSVYLYASLIQLDDLYFRIKRTRDEKVSDIHFTSVRGMRTNFIKQSIIEGLAGNNIVTDAFVSTNIFNFFQMNFRLKNFSNDDPYLRMINPIRNKIIQNDSVHFSWHPIENNNISTLQLIVSDCSNTVCQSINVINMTNYVWNIPHNYNYGIYHWQLKAISNNNENYSSEVWPFIIADDLTDTDNDGYFDVEEIARGSDPNDPKDFPFVIRSQEECQPAFKEQQYFNVLKANINEQLKWNHIGYLPEGIVLTEHGVLRGRAQNTGDYVFTVFVYDRKGKTDEKTLYLKVLQPAPSYIRCGNGSVR